MKTQYTTHFLGNDEEPLQLDMISAVFLVALKEDKVLSIKNERGWDVPGGHLEENEDLLAGLEREVMEEAGALVKNATPFATLSSSKSQKIMLFFASNSIDLVDFTPSEDALDRDFLLPEELLRRYYGERDLLHSLIEGAKNSLKCGGV